MQEKRRSFLNWLLGGSTTALFSMVFYPVFRFMNAPSVPEAATSQVEAGTTSDPELLDKGFKIIPFGSEPVILVRVSETDFRAFDATCTHLDCIVEFQPDSGLIVCNCHNGEYDLSGRTVGGPPPRPLNSYDVHLLPNQPGAPQTIVIARA